MFEVPTIHVITVTVIVIFFMLLQSVNVHYYFKDYYEDQLNYADSDLNSEYKVSRELDYLDIYNFNYSHLFENKCKIPNLQPSKKTFIL